MALNELIQDKNDFGIYHATQQAFDNVIWNNLPEALQQQENLPALAIAGGFAGGFMLPSFAQETARYIGRKNPWVYEKALPIAENICKYGLPMAAATYAMIDPDGALHAIETKPMDNWGLMWAYFGGLTAIGLRRRRDAAEAEKESPSNLPE